MKVNMNFGYSVLNLPKAVLKHLPDVNGDALKVLLRLAADDGVSEEALADELDITPKKVAKAIALWRELGVITDGEITTTASVQPAKVPESPSKPKTDIKTQDSASTAATTKSQAVPRYSTEELTGVLERRRELAELIDECSRVFGKVFSTHEVGILVGIVDYLNVDGEYLLLLLAHCAKLGKKSVRYAETIALSLYDEGATDSGTLQECLKRKEHLAEAEGKIRMLFGMSNRALTAKEKKLITTWLFTYGYDMDIITRAYEITVDATGKPSVPYAGSILDRWAAADLHTLADIEKADAARAAQGKTPATPGNSFDTDDFFGAALQRSFGEDFKPNKK